MAWSDVTKFLVTLAFLGAIAFLAHGSHHEPFRVYAPGGGDYTSANVSIDPCPFENDAEIGRAHV